MAPVRRSHDRRIQGFTLIETLATLALTGVIVSTLTILTGQWMSGWNYGASRLQRASLVAVALDRLALDLESAVTIPSIGRVSEPSFDGSERSILFIRPTSGPGAASTLDIVKLYVSADAILMRAHAPYDPRVAVDATIMQDEVALLHEQYEINFMYLDPSGRWVARWRGPIPPSSIRAIFNAPKNSGRNDIVTNFATHVNIPVICARARTLAACDALIATKSALVAQTPDGPASKEGPGDGN